MSIKQLSVLVPGIRTKNWEILYNSIGKSFSHPWEIIFVGPKPPPDSLKDKDNVKFIKDFGAPTRCQQIGLVNAEGEYVTWAADDGIFLPQALDVAFDTIVANGKKKLVVGKYIEGIKGMVGLSIMKYNIYYFLSFHKNTISEYIDKSFLMLNVGLVSRQLLLDVGGWDCRFEVCPLAYNDLAIRLQTHGISFDLQQELMFVCSHLPEHQGDHGPIHDAQTLHDHPLFMEIYSHPESVKRIHIDLDNWKRSPDMWKRRFKNAD